MQEELKFIELIKGTKKAKTKWNITHSSMDNLEDASLLLNDYVVDADFDGDNGPKEEWIKDYLKGGYPKEPIETEKGLHFLYGMLAHIKFKSNSDVIAVGGFQLDYKTGNQLTVVKRNGVVRKGAENLTLKNLPELPEILYPLSKKQVNLSNMRDGDGRNEGLFKHLCAVRQKYPSLDIERIGEFINSHIFAEPLSDSELNSTINSVLSREFTEIKQKEIKPLQIISAVDLKNIELSPIKFIVEGMLPQGLNLICSPPKYGKSWLMLDLCLSVAKGDKFLNQNTNQCNCLYLALEDSLHRLKDRMDKVLNGNDPPPNFDYAIKCENLSTGLIEQLNKHLLEKPNTELIVIDTLQKIRGNSQKSDSAYGNDYVDLGKLKSFADEKGICILLVHHLRKMGDSGDVFSRISGTNAIMGASDTIFILSRENRTDEETILSMTGRDIEETNFILKFDKISFKWQLLGGLEAQLEQKKHEEYENDLTIKTIKALLEENEGSYGGTATDIFNKCFELFGDYAESTPAVLSKRIRDLAPPLYKHDGIIHTAPPENGAGGKRLHKFTHKDKATINDL